MTDLFALLGIERRPWLDGEELKARYHELTAREHPDVAGGSGESGDFAEINRAYQTLSEPAARLRHLLELEGRAQERTQAAPEEIAVFFAAVAETNGAVEAFVKKRAGAGSPLAKALLSGEQFELQERVTEMIARLQVKEEELLERVREADGRWEGERAAVLGELAGLWQGLGYVGKWLGGLREAVLRVAGI